MRRWSLETSYRGSYGSYLLLDILSQKKCWRNLISRQHDSQPDNTIQAAGARFVPIHSSDWLWLLMWSRVSQSNVLTPHAYLNPVLGSFFFKKKTSGNGSDHSNCPAFVHEPVESWSMVLMESRQECEGREEVPLCLKYQWGRRCRVVEHTRRTRQFCTAPYGTSSYLLPSQIINIISFPTVWLNTVWSLFPTEFIHFSKLSQSMFL